MGKEGLVLDREALRHWRLQRGHTQSGADVAKRPGFEALIAHLDGYTIALELAASFLARYPEVTPAEYLELLSQGKGDQLEEEVQTRTPYQQTLERALELLWERSPHALRAAWALAATFSDERASHELADACGLGRQTRAQLRDFHLLQGGPLGWTMHRLIRSFARRRSLPDLRKRAREQFVRGCAARLATAPGVRSYGQDRAHFDLALQYGEALPAAVEAEFARLQLEVGALRAVHFGHAGADELLRQAARFYGELAGQLDAVRDRPAHARAQFQRARALHALGAWGFTVDALRQAVDAVRESLEHWDPVRQTEEWTQAQILLGNALGRLADRVKEPQGYTGAIEAFEKALERLDPQQDLARWARIQRAAAIALASSGTNSGSLEPQREALRRIRAIPSAALRELDPFEWVEVQSTLGQALSHLGTAAADPVMLREGVAELERVLQVIAPESHPTLWARSHLHCANSHRELAELDDSEAAESHLQRAVSAFRASLSVIDRERLPMPWAATMSCLGDALRGLGHLRPESSAWEESLHCKELSLQEYGPTRDAHVWALVLGELGLTRCLIAARNADPATARQGADECRTALAALPPAEMSLLRMMIRVRAAEAFLLAGGTTGEHSAWTEAAQCLEAARAEPAAADRGVWFTRIEAPAERTRAAQAGISRSVPGAQHTQPS